MSRGPWRSARAAGFSDFGRSRSLVHTKRFTSEISINCFGFGIVSLCSDALESCGSVPTMIEQSIIDCTVGCSASPNIHLV